MKLDQFELEIMCLAHITRNAKCMEKLLARNVKLDHFTHIAPSDRQSFTQGLFKLVTDYWESSGGSLFTSYVLESKFLEYNVSDKIKTLIMNGNTGGYSSNSEARSGSMPKNSLKTESDSDQVQATNSI